MKRRWTVTFPFKIATSAPTKNKNAPDEPDVKEAPAAEVKEEAPAEVAETPEVVEAPKAEEVTPEAGLEPEDSPLVDEPSADELEAAEEGSPEIPGEIDDKENQA